MPRLCRTLVALPLVLMLGCQTARSYYYDAWESMGYAKRERLVDNVKAAKDEQVEAKQQFTSALDQFKALVNFSGGDLEKMYKQLNDEYEACVSQADDVRSRIQSVKNVSKALFDEWQTEIKQISDDSLRADSVRLRDETKRSYDEMITRMDAAAASMDPVLKQFKDRVLSLKHRLNAAAIASLKGEEAKIGADVEKLLADMNASIARADAFIAEIQPPK
jgi:SMC interacting uncharacterized protein involved in chromosome segregation